MRSGRLFTVATAGDRIALLPIPVPDSESRDGWASIATIQFGSQVNSIAWHSPKSIVAATELGITVLELA